MEDRELIIETALKKVTGCILYSSPGNINRCKRCNVITKANCKDRERKFGEFVGCSVESLEKESWSDYLNKHYM